MSSATYTYTMYLNPSVQEKQVLEKYFEIGRQMYNYFLNCALKRLHQVQNDHDYQMLLKEYRGLKGTKDKTLLKRKKEITKELIDIQGKYRFRKFDMQDFVPTARSHFGKDNNPGNCPIGAHETRKLAFRAFNAVEKMLYGKSKKIRFKRKDDAFSIENEDNSAGLRYWTKGPKQGTITWQGLKLTPRPAKSVYDLQVLMDRTKYVRMVRKQIKGKICYLAQLIQEGTPPENKSHTIGKGRVGIDIGPSTIAVSSETETFIAVLAPGIERDEEALAKMQRKLNRSRRATNPQNYNEDGTIKKGPKKWTYSNRYKKLKAEIADQSRVLAEKRKIAHEELANRVLSLGDEFYVENMDFRVLAMRAKETTRNKKNGRINSKKRFGKTIGNRAPGMFLEILDRKLHYYGKELHKVNTRTVKASQYNHITGTYIKKDLNERWNDMGNGDRVQRDLYSAFLIQHVNKKMDKVDQALCIRSYGKFKTLHDKEISRLSDLKKTTKIPSSIGV